MKTQRLKTKKKVHVGDSSSKWVVAMDLGGTKLATAFVSNRGKVQGYQKCQVDFSGGPEALNDFLADKYKILQQQRRVLGLALASAGPQDFATGELLNPTNFGASRDTAVRWPLVKPLQKKIKSAIFFDNDAAAAARAEHFFGANRGTKNSMVITLGTGVGVGVVLDGKVLRAGSTRHPEAGHLLLEPNDQEIETGALDSGTVESFLGGPHFSKRMKKKFGPQFSSIEETVERARGGESLAKQIFFVYGKWLGLALFNYCILFYPERIAFSGGVSHASEFFLDVAKEELRTRLGNRLGSSVQEPKISQAKFKDEAGLLGAAVGFFQARG